LALSNISLTSTPLRPPSLPYCQLAATIDESQCGSHATQKSVINRNTDNVIHQLPRQMLQENTNFTGKKTYKHAQATKVPQYRVSVSQYTRR